MSYLVKNFILVLNLLIFFKEVFYTDLTETLYLVIKTNFVLR